MSIDMKKFNDELLKGTLVSLGCTINGLEGMGNKDKYVKDLRKIFFKLEKELPVKMLKKVYHGIGWLEFFYDE